MTSKDLYEAWEKWLAYKLAENPELTRSEAHEKYHSGFTVGWNTREAVARDNIGNYFYGEDELNVIKELVHQSLAEKKLNIDKALRRMADERTTARMVQGLRDQIKNQRQSEPMPFEHRRITNQRRELKRLERENNELRGRLAKQEEQDSK